MTPYLVFLIGSVSVHAQLVLVYLFELPRPLWAVSSMVMIPVSLVSPYLMLVLISVTHFRLLSKRLLPPQLQSVPSLALQFWVTSPIDGVVNGVY